MPERSHQLPLPQCDPFWGNSQYQFFSIDVKQGEFVKKMKEILYRTRAALLQVISDLELQVRTLTTVSALQDNRLADLEARSSPGVHSLQVAQENLIQGEIDRRSELNDQELKIDLEALYGKTNWARRLISEILTIRIEKRAFRNSSGPTN